MGKIIPNVLKHLCWLLKVKQMTVKEIRWDVPAMVLQPHRTVLSSVEAQISKWDLLVLADKTVLSNL